MRRSPRALTPFAWGIFSLALVAAVSCKRDLDTGPAAQRAATQPPAKTVEVTLGTFRIPIPADNFNGGAQPDVGSGIVVPAGSYYRIRVHGSVIVSINPDAQTAYPDATFPAVGSYGPGGTSGGELVVGLQYCATGGCGSASLLNLQGGTSAPDSAYSDILYAPTQREIHVSRGGLAAGIGGPNGSFGKYRLQSQQDLTVEKLTDFVHVNASPSHVKANQQVTFTASRDDGGRLDMSSWEWRPSVGNISGPCGASNPCLMNVPVSGTMIAHTWAFGDASADVTVYSSFALDADKTSVRSGDTVTFTPKYDAVAGPAARWKWVPTDTSQHDGAPCTPTEASCKKEMLESGTMWAFTSATVGQGDSASQAISVTPSITLKCSPKPVTRGQSTTCTATTKAPGQLIPTSWVFSATADPQLYQVTTVTRADNISNTTWPGTIAASGVVTVNGTINGFPAQAGVDTIVVQDRAGWTWHGATSATSDAPGQNECSLSPHYAAMAPGSVIPLGWAIGTQCDNQSYMFSPHYSTGNGGVQVVDIHDGGPNATLWYVADISVTLAMHAQVLKDVRPDGFSYSFTASSDSATTAACAAASVVSPTTATTTNLVCRNNSGYSLFYNDTWRHERCHMTVAIAKFESLPDAKALGERVVASDSLGAWTTVLIQANGLQDAGFAISSASKQLDSLPGSTYDVWSYTPASMAWQLQSLPVANGIVTGC
jgi:hypothetical protein